MPTSNERAVRQRRSLATDILSGWIKTSFILRRLVQDERDACSRTVITLARNRVARRLFGAVSNNEIGNSFEGYAAQRVARLAKNPVAMPYGGPPEVTNADILAEICGETGKIMVFSIHTGFSFIISLLSPHRKVMSIATSLAHGQEVHEWSGTTHLGNVRLVESNPFSFAKFIKDRDHHIYCALVDGNRSGKSPFAGVNLDPFHVAVRYKVPVYFARFVFQPDASVVAVLARPVAGETAEEMAQRFLRFQGMERSPQPPANDAVNSSNNSASPSPNFTERG